MACHSQARPVENQLARELTLRSLKKRINQFKEEIARFEAHARPTADSK